ncbi:MAG TPA: lytic transglycosylase domain-containing protein [Gaiellaceae bacterium]|nr:lytic transglycosylase domain-containing protein [Gaiellaceae bacterium]
MRRAGLVLVAFVLVMAVTAAMFVLTREEERPPPPALALPSEIVGPDPLVFESGQTAAYERAAAFGLSHALFAKSPGGIAAAVRRTAAFRSLIEDAASGSDFDADLVEAIVFLESAGRPDVIAGHDVEHAAGLTQILAETATNFLGMPVDLAASRQLTKQIEDARRRRDREEVEALLAERRRVDARFDPAQALAGTVRYLTEARRWLGRDDLAVVSYHMGIGNLESVLRAYSGRETDPIENVVDDEGLDYARVYFDSSPVRNQEAWERLASLGDDSQTYYWRVLAAHAIMRVSRDDPRGLERMAELHGRGPSAELVLHPPGVRLRFATADDLGAAVGRGVLRPLPRDPARQRFVIDPRLDRITSRLAGDPAAYRSLGPRALGVLRYVAGQVYELSGEERPLTVTRAAYDEVSGPALTPPDLDEATHASLHATGYTFDVRRRYGSGTQAQAFQWTLERLQALGLIAWTRGEAVIHITASPRADVGRG